MRQSFVVEVANVPKVDRRLRAGGSALIIEEERREKERFIIIRTGHHSLVTIPIMRPFRRRAYLPDWQCQCCWCHVAIARFVLSSLFLALCDDFSGDPF